MSRFFRSPLEEKSLSDDTGTEFAEVEKARDAAMHLLPEIAADQIPKDGDKQRFTVLVKDGGGAPVYSATLSYSGTWFNKSGCAGRHAR